MIMPSVPPAAMAPAAVERAYPPVQHFGERDLGHGGGGGDRGSRYRPKPGAGANRGVDQSAF
jgi:hypothetical protein